MSFTRVNPAGWAFGELLTNTQMNALDLDHSRAVDGYAGGNFTPSGTVSFDGTSVFYAEVLESPVIDTITSDTASCATAIDELQGATIAGYPNSTLTTFQSRAPITVFTGTGLPAWSVAADTAIDDFVHVHEEFFSDPLYAVIEPPLTWEAGTAGDNVYEWGLDSIRVTMIGASGHGGMPGTKPLVSVYMNGSFVTSAEATEATTAAFEAVHTVDVAIDPGSSGQDPSSKIMIAVDPESGINAITGLHVGLQVICDWTLTVVQT